MNILRNAISGAAVLPLLLAATLAAGPAAHAAGKPAPKPQAQQAAEPLTQQTAAESLAVASLLNAIQNKDYSQFTGLGTENFGKLDRQQFDAVAGQLAPRLQAGFQVQRLGDYHQQSYQFSLWKITFKDNGDDLIGTLNMQGGKVGGFVLR